MKYISVILAGCLFCASPAGAGVTPELWDAYLSKTHVEPACGAACPGRLLASASPAFSLAWKYRAMTYEVHYDDQKALARAVYDLAIRCGDIPSTTTREQVERGVQGFHYSMDQVCAWLDDVFAGERETPTRDTLLLMGYLLRDEAIRLEKGKFVPCAPIRHIVAAAPGTKRSLDENLRHERLHVLWDEDQPFRQRVRSAWDAMSETEKVEADKKMKRYTDNFELRLEEWGVREALANRIATSAI